MRLLTVQVRQLLGERDGRREAGEPRPLGHRWTGGLRPTAPALLPTDRLLSLLSFLAPLIYASLFGPLASLASLIYALCASTFLSSFFRYVIRC